MINFEHTYKQLPDIFYSETKPASLDNPRLIILNKELMAELGLNLEKYSDEELAAFFTGQVLSKTSQPIALCYAGHQFGHFNPRLGDGRAILLGEVLTSQNKRYDIQLKGSGRTLYSRGGDGKSWIGPVLREYIVSEAMFYLDIPTTRALAACETGEKVIREKSFPGGILTRVAKSHIRIGTFEYFAGISDYENLKILADYTINRHYPHLIEDEDKYLKLIYEVALRQSKLIAKWMGVGFIHGVMNTDNMSISGETIDYGPCAFMDNFSHTRVFSSIDRQRRYAYNNQIDIGMWNLSRFASCLIPLINENHEEAIEKIQMDMNNYIHIYEKEWLIEMLKKFGFNDLKQGDDELIKLWQNALEEKDLDFTLSYRELAENRFDFNQSEKFKLFKSLYEKRGQIDYDLMKRTNPLLIPRNHVIEDIIQKALKNDYEDFFLLVEAIKSPYQVEEKFKKFLNPPLENEKISATFCGT